MPNLVAEWNAFFILRKKDLNTFYAHIELNYYHY